MKSNTHQLFTPAFQQKLFNSFADKYNTLVNKFSFGISNKIRKELIATIPINTSKISILDLMCGGGENWGFITHQFPNATIHAVDFSEKMIAVANQKNLKHYNSTIKIQCDNIFEIHFENEKFDLVVCSFGIKCMDENKYAEFAKQLKNILLPNGIFAYTEIKLPNNFILKQILLFYFRLIIPYVSLSFLNKQSGINYLHTYLQKFDGGTKLNTALLNEKMTLQQATSFWQIATIVIAKNK